MCCIYPNFLHSIKIIHLIYLHILKCECIIFSIKVVYDLEVLVQIDTACSRVDCYCIHNMMQYKLDLSHSSQQWESNFPFSFWQASHAQPLN